MGLFARPGGHKEVPHQNPARESESSARVAARVPRGGSEKETLGRPAAMQPTLSSCPSTSCGTFPLAGTKAEPRAVSLQGQSWGHGFRVPCTPLGTATAALPTWQKVPEDGSVFSKAAKFFSPPRQRLAAGGTPSSSEPQSTGSSPQPLPGFRSRLTESLLCHWGVPAFPPLTCGGQQETLMSSLPNE